MSAAHNQVGLGLRVKETMGELEPVVVEQIITRAVAEVLEQLVGTQQQVLMRRVAVVLAQHLLFLGLLITTPAEGAGDKLPALRRAATVVLAVAVAGRAALLVLVVPEGLQMAVLVGPEVMLPAVTEVIILAVGVAAVLTHLEMAATVVPV